MPIQMEISIAPSDEEENSNHHYIPKKNEKANQFKTLPSHSLHLLCGYYYTIHLLYVSTEWAMSQ